MPDMWYMRPDSTSVQYDPNRAPTVGVLSFITSFVLYGYLIPIR